VRRASLGGLLAAGLPETPAELRHRHQREWDGPSSLLSPEGIRAWEPWPGDETPPPVLVDLQWTALRALSTDADDTRRPRALRVIRNRLLSQLREGGGLGESLQQTPSDPGWRPGTAALLLYAIQECAGTADVRPLSPAMRWAEKNRRTLGLAVVGAITLLFTLPIALSSLQKDVSHAPQATLAGLAKNKYVLGHYDEAIALYRDLLNQFPESDLIGDYNHMLANAHFHRQEWAEAETLYRKAAQLRPQFPQPLWNLAQALHRQNRIDEALAVLDDVEKRFVGKFPAFRRKVEDARQVIRQQQAFRAAPLRPPSQP
jgi:Tetratricopeptide repeat